MAAFPQVEPPSAKGGLAAFDEALYIQDAVLRRASGDQFPGALTIPKGAVPDLARGLGHTAPTYFVGFPGSPSPTALVARTLFFIYLPAHERC
jgi:hypothetical protein